jgi:hypothetical protein
MSLFFGLMIVMIKSKNYDNLFIKLAVTFDCVYYVISLLTLVVEYMYIVNAKTTSYIYQITYYQYFKF